MPIRPENRKRYPKSWKQMVEAARERSGDRCECDGRCGRAHSGGRCAARHRQKHPDTGNLVILTLAHFHGVPLESEDIGQMFHACQACHNRYDAPERQAAARARAFAERSAGQIEMFPVELLGIDPAAAERNRPS